MLLQRCRHELENHSNTCKPISRHQKNKAQKEMRMKLYKTVAISILEYDIEARVVNKRQESHIQATSIRCDVADQIS